MLGSVKFISAASAEESERITGAMFPDEGLTRVLDACGQPLSVAVLQLRVFTCNKNKKHVKFSYCPRDLLTYLSHLHSVKVYKTTQKG